MNFPETSERVTFLAKMRIFPWFRVNLKIKGVVPLTRVYIYSINPQCLVRRVPTDKNVKNFAKLIKNQNLVQKKT